MFQAIALSFFIVLWLCLGSICWLVISVRSRGQAGFVWLPLAAGFGVLGGVLVPLLGLTGWQGMVVSLPAAVLLSSLALLMARRRWPWLAGTRAANRA